MAKFSAFIFVAALISASTGSAKTIDVTIYSDNAYLPYSYATKEGVPQGIYTEVLRKAFASMKDYRVTIVPKPWTRALNALEKSEVFAVYPPYYRPIERPYIGEYSVPILEEDIVVFARKSPLNSQQKNWPHDWQGSRVGLFTGTIDIAGPEFFKQHSQGKFTVVEAIDNEQNLRNLITRRVDVYVNDRNAVQYTLRKLKHRGEWPLNAPELEEVATVSKEQGYVAFARDERKYPFRNDFIKKFNAAILRMQKNREIENITQEYLNHSAEAN